MKEAGDTERGTGIMEEGATPAKLDSEQNLWAPGPETEDRGFLSKAPLNGPESRQSRDILRPACRDIPRHAGDPGANPAGMGVIIDRILTHYLRAPLIVGAILLVSVQGVSVNVDPVFCTWLLYQPHRGGGARQQQQQQQQQQVPPPHVSLYMLFTTFKRVSHAVENEQPPDPEGIANVSLPPLLGRLSSIPLSLFI
ncbi:Vacuolar protein sorting-associated protein 13B [Liparis tanakae]|uniref:Vacuolar protein sorting-associated protein 13B n=1 Tax=Liparis tanakae TaxID=230148 RepID=A0A4Z2ECL8_9TELE|nr:Vacuolar protein sorting-associated protein 13B [Liparis tanakae]